MATAYEKLMAADNYTIINAILKELPQGARITPASKGMINRTLDDLTSQMPTFNAFVNTMVNRIATTVVRNMSFENPLKEFKSGKISFGSSVQTLHVNPVTAQSYDTQRDYLERDLFAQARPDIEQNIHNVNRRDFYKITVNQDMVAEAFTTDGGVMELVNAILATPYLSDEIDEFNLMCSLIPAYEERGGFFRVNVPDARSFDSGASEAKNVLRKLKAFAGLMSLPSQKYNAAKRMNASRKDDLVLFGTPEFFAAIDVEALAGAFNIERMAAGGRQIAIPDENFGLKGAQAVLTTTDFFQVHDRILEATSQPNPVGLYTNHFLHHHQIMSLNRFANAILFHTGEADDNMIVIKPPTGVGEITMTNTATGATIAKTSKIVRGAKVQMSATIEGEDSVAAIEWSVTGNTDAMTHITKDGVLIVGWNEEADSVKVTATVSGATDVQPHAPDFEAELAVKIDTDSLRFNEWPNQRANETDYSPTSGEESPNP